jgi:hypothetical protein
MKAAILLLAALAASASGAWNEPTIPDLAGRAVGAAMGAMPGMDECVSLFLFCRA